MAIRIIKEGQLPEEKPKQATCPNCKAELEYRSVDVRLAEDSIEQVRFITCPCCEVRFVV